MNSFETRVDGQLVKTKTETKAYANQKDITERLKAHGYTDGDIVSTLSCRIDSMAECMPDSLNKLVPGIKKDGSPSYQAQQTAWWE